MTTWAGRRGGKGEGGGSRVVWTAPMWPSSGWRGPGRGTFRECRRLGLSHCCENPPDKDTKTGRCQDLEKKSGRTRQWHRVPESQGWANPLWVDRDLGAVWGCQRGEKNPHGNGSRRRHAAKGQAVEAVWWQAGGNVEVFGASQQEIGWGAGENSDGLKEEQLPMGRR